MSKSVSKKLPETKQPLASNIYKVKLITDGTVNTIFVFTGKRIEESETELKVLGMRKLFEPDDETDFVKKPMRQF